MFGRGREGLFLLLYFKVVQFQAKIRGQDLTETTDDTTEWSVISARGQDQRALFLAEMAENIAKRQVFVFILAKLTRLFTTRQWR